MDYETRDINSILRTVRINTVIVKFVTRYNVHLLEFELLVQHSNNAKCYKPGGQQCYMHSHSAERIGKRIYCIYPAGPAVRWSPLGGVEVVVVVREVSTAPFSQSNGSVSWIFLRVIAFRKSSRTY